MHADIATGLDLDPATPPTAPVSRAFFKMHELLQTDAFGMRERRGCPTGLDLGAAPGGWTQALRLSGAALRVLAVDPGRVAKRVMDLGVTHTGGTFARRRQSLRLPQLCSRGWYRT